MKRVGLWALALALIALPCVAQDRASVRADVDGDIVSLGDRVTLTVEVEHLPGQTVAWPALPDTLGSFEVLGMETGAPVVAQGRQGQRRADGVPDEVRLPVEDKLEIGRGHRQDPLDDFEEDLARDQAPRIPRFILDDQDHLMQDLEEQIL